MNSTLALISGLALVSGLGLGLGLETSGLGLGLEALGLGLEAFGLGLGLETPGLVNIPAMATCKKLSGRGRLRSSAAPSFYFGTPSICPELIKLGS